MSNIGKHIAKYRKAKGLTQDALGEQLHVTRQTISSWENGRTLPDVEMLTHIGESLEVSVEQLIYGKDIKTEHRDITGYKRMAIISGVILLICIGAALWIKPQLGYHSDIDYSFLPELWYKSILWPLVYLAGAICLLSLISFKADIILSNGTRRRIFRILATGAITFFIYSVTVIYSFLPGNPWVKTSWLWIVNYPQIFFLVGLCLFLGFNGCLEDEKRFIGKEITIVCIAVFGVFLFVGNIRRKEEKSVDMDILFVDTIYSVNDNVYTVRNDGEDSYIQLESSEEKQIYSLVSQGYKKDSSPLWHEETGRLYFRDGHKVYACNETGEEKEFLWELPKGSDGDFAEIMATTEDYLILEGSYQKAGSSLFSVSDGYYPDRNYYSLDIKTGEAVLLMEEVDISKLPLLLCTYQDEMFYLQLTDNIRYETSRENGEQAYRETVIARMNLRTGERNIIGSFETLARHLHGDGIVWKDTLYYTCNSSGVYSIPLTGGTIEYTFPDIEQVPEMDSVADIKDYDGTVYILMKEGNDYPPYAFCEWDMTTGIVTPIITWDGTFSPSDIYIHDGMYYFYSGTKVCYGKLEK